MNIKSAFFGVVIIVLLWKSVGVMFTYFVGTLISYIAIYLEFTIVLMSMVWLYISRIILLLPALFVTITKTQSALSVIKPQFG